MRWALPWSSAVLSDAQKASAVSIYRWAVFLLAAGYTIRMVLFSEYDGFAGPFRYLTIWALILSFFCASRMMALVEGRSDARWDGLVGATAVINLMVVFLYWRLFFADPTSVTRDGKLGDWWLEYYLHALGPLLQWIDALFIHRSFTRLRASALWLVGIVISYVIWVEYIVQSLANTPSGSVTSGLPYRFLNDLELGGRMTFYATNLVTALVFLLVFAGLAAAIRRVLRQPAAH
ncbi:hypothetical protein [Pelagovum sp. HNIBRBA483]|uniref:hypothetical protein n=1 Tax=Pelagovum sp. HNIBRBA483 TaxID=3233341 RepID=UPI0034A32E2E